jgi:WhiB family redox-sensing transcriptional regulator
MNDLAACRSVDPELFFPPLYGPSYGKRVAAAKALCRLCTGQRRCLAEAMAREEQFGIWGGTTPQERASLARRVAR